MKPILFNTEMTKAILDGRKTVTRRVIKFNNGQTPIKNGREKFHGLFNKLNNKKGCFAGFYKDSDIYDFDGEQGIDALYAKSSYKVGDILYVRETWKPWGCEECAVYDCIGCSGPSKYAYKATGSWDSEEKWTPSIHMPKEAARIFLKVTRVGVEKLQDMRHDEPMKEGIRSYTKDGVVHKFAPCDGWMPWSEMPRNPTKAFELLWNSTIKKADIDEYGWDANPWVWVIEFERCENEAKE